MKHAATSLPALRLPQEVSLVAQTFALLKQGIQSGAWLKFLPGENELCEHFHVSRVTLRKALGQLQRAGWVRARQGKRRQIVKGFRSPIRSADKRVVLLTPTSLESLHPFAIFWIDSLRQHLGEANFHLEIHTSRAVYGSKPSRALRELLGRLQPAGWVLYHSTAQMQQWFSDQGLPCVITGSRHSGVQLLSVDTDYRAACRHAAGQFLRRGHKRLALVNPESSAAGDLESEQGFKEAAALNPSLETQVIVVRHDGTISGICYKMDALLQRPGRPTALLVSRPGHALTVMNHLMRSGLRLPQDMALISRDDDTFLEHAVPKLARYSSSPIGFARKLSKVVLKAVQGGIAGPTDHRLMPRFINGQTLE